MKIFELFACLSNEELKLLRKAVISPLYNTNQKVVRLFEILRPLHPYFDDSVKSRKKLFKKLFPKEAYNDYKLRWHFTELTKVIEQLLLYIGQEADEFERQKRLSEMYRQRDLYTFFNKENEALLTTINTTKQLGAAQYLQKLQLLSSNYFHPAHNKYDINDLSLSQAMNSLDIFFVLQKLRLAIALKSREQVLNETHTIFFLEAINIAQKNGFENANKLLLLYLQALTLSDNEDVINFSRYEQNLFENIESFELIDQQFLFFAGLNFVVKKRNKGDASFKEKPFLWYQFGLRLELLLIEGKIEETAFANIIGYGCELNHFNWVKTFIEKYKVYLNAKEGEETINYYYGLFCYLSGDWDQSLEILLSSEKKSIYPPRNRAIIVRSLFEKFLIERSYFEVLLAQVLALESYIRRDKYFAEGKLIQYLNFIRIIKKIARMIYANEPTSSIKKWYKIETNKHIPILAKHWIAQKILNL